MPRRWHWRDLHRQRPAPIHVKRGAMRDAYPPHDHDFLEIVLITAGRVVHRHAGGSETLGAGDALVVRPDTWHAYDEAAFDYWDCAVPADVLRRELAWTAADPVLSRLLWSAPFEGAGTGILRLRLAPAQRAAAVEQCAALAELADARDPGGRAAALGRLLVLTGILASALGAGADRTAHAGEAAAHPAVQRAIAILIEDPARDWPLAALAAELALAPAYLARLFSAATGLPPRAWLIRHRLELAAGLLLRTDLPVGTVGARVGWTDANLFARRFRAQYGASASAWRERYRAAPGLASAERA